MNTINFELSKRLNEWWYLDNIETKYWYRDNWILLEYWIYRILNDWEWVYYKTLTLEEVLEFLPKEFKNDKLTFFLNFWPMNNIWYCQYEDWFLWKLYWETWQTFLEAIEKMLEFLLDNNLLWTQKQ